MERRRKIIDIDNSFVDKLVALYISLSLLIASFLAELLTGGIGNLLRGFIKIIISPSPLITDYFALGSLSGAFFNAFLCGISCTLLMFLLKAQCNYSTYAGFFLVVGHSFYGLNALNMWPPIVGILVYSLLRKIKFSDNLAIAFYSTAFGPFVSELLFRYPLTVSTNQLLFSPRGIIAVILLAAFLGFAVPALLNGAKLLHREMSLYNGGLAFGLLGMLIFSFMYNIMGVSAPKNNVPVPYPIEEAQFSFLFCNIFFIFVFVIALIIGWYMNGESFEGYNKLLKDPGFKTDFLEKYGDGVTMINLGFYGLMMVLYFDLCIIFTEGVSFNGAVCGIILASVTFSASGQHPKNVWPILIGYVITQLIVSALCSLANTEMTWSISTQAYMSGAAFATGLCPFTGRYGKTCGVFAGIISAIISTATLVMHGGFVLYNGGLVAGMAALILSPFIDHYFSKQ